MRRCPARWLQNPRSGSKSGAPMIGSSSMSSSAATVAARSSGVSARQSSRTRSGKRRRSFHIFQKIFHEHQLPPPDLLFSAREMLPQCHVARDLDRLAQREVLVMRDEDGHVAAVAGEDGSLAAD